MNNFNFLAPIYDLLARLVFGQNLHQASIHFLNDIPSNSKVLVLGGGTGRILTDLEGNQVTYVEKSQKMLNRAKERQLKELVNFIHTDFLKWESDQQFDVVICPFFLDVFDEDNLNLVLDKMRSSLDSNGQLMVTDFEPSELKSYRLLLKIMHLFFRLFSSLESRRLKPIRQHILQSGFRIEAEKFWLNGLIFSLKARL